MKRTITSIATVLLMVMTLSSFATSNSNPLKYKDAKEILLTYTEAASEGNIEFNNFLFTENFKYSNKANETTYTKKAYISFLNSNKGLQYNCETKHEVLNTSTKMAVAKTTFKFDCFTRVDHITLVQTDEGWKISNIVTSYL